MLVFFTPYFDENPYQRNLSDSLSKIGVEVKHIEYVANRLFPVLRAAGLHGIPDVVHLHWTDRFMLGRSTVLSIFKFVHFVLELLILKILGVRLIWTVHNIYDHEKRHPVLEKYFHRVCCRILYDNIIVLSSFTVDAAIHNYNLPERLRKKFFLIPHGNYINNYINKITRVATRDILGIAEDKFVFLYFGQIRSYKGIFYLIEEFKKISDPHAVLLIVGRTSTEALGYEIENSCLGNKQIKTYLRFVADDEIETFMNSSDIVVFPFQDILNSGSVILAMSFGKAVLCPNMGSIPEIINNKGGILYNPNDPSGLSQSLKLALKSDLNSLGQYNFQKAKSLNWNQIAMDTYKVYKQFRE